jgi:RNA polymerase sigma-70 factor (ECF subfamily)
MDQTPVSLLERLRNPATQEVMGQAWTRFVKLYTPLLYHWARRLGLQSADAADLVQDVFALLLRKLPQFTYDRQKSFRSWLRTVLLNKWREKGRRPSLVPHGTSPLPPDLAGDDSAEQFAEAEYRQYLTGRALELMQAEFQPATWKACWEHVVSGRSAAEVAAELGISEGAVYVAKHRVLRRLRQEMAGLLD